MLHGKRGRSAGEASTEEDDFYAMQINVAVDVVAQFRFEGPLGNYSCFLTGGGAGCVKVRSYVTAHSPRNIFLCIRKGFE
jgi:hypothetical protein